MKPKAREEDLIVEALSGETIVYDRKRDKVHRLNHTATLIWRQCDGQTTVAEMATRLRQQDLPADEEVVWLALDRLGKTHLLQERVMRSGEEISRRAVMRKLALAGGLTALLPVVTSIVAPTPAMAQSPGNGGNGGAGSPLCAAAAPGAFCVIPSLCQPPNRLQLGQYDCPSTNVCCVTI